MSKALRYNKDKIDWSVLDVDFYEAQELEYEARMYGVEKYTIEAEGIDGLTNWKSSIGTEDHEGFMLGCLESANRHLRALRRGEYTDHESGIPHVGFIRVNMGMFQYYFSRWNTKST